MNILCVVMAAISMFIYKVYEINCPCLPRYNLTYGLIVIFIPPFIFFFLGFSLNHYCLILSLELSKPQNKRKKKKEVLRFMFKSMVIRSLVAPVLWIIACFLDGKSVICAFSETLDAEQFGGFGNFSSISTELLLAKVPCKNFELLRTSSTRKAIYRFLKSISQGVGFLMVLILIILAVVSRILSSIFNISRSIHTQYWSIFANMEDQFFEETCLAHNRWMAEKCINGYFEECENYDVKCSHDDEEKIISPWQMMDYVDHWYLCRPPIVHTYDPLSQS
ncbi:calcium homeostasis modulator protein 3-like [Pelobates fuscus]|uniref:calcium homeostasis modulator protein 3-like n=1 Tax=Pelobates fuscus TaxID=191477 RepID=UPI002FE4B6F0